MDISRRRHSRGDTDDTVEMSIVDLFTKLIFGDTGEFDECELSILQALRTAEANVSMDDYQEIGAYLRALGVNEMIALVASVKQGLGSAPPALSALQTKSHALRYQP